MNEWMEVGKPPFHLPENKSLKLRLEDLEAIPEELFNHSSLEKLWIHGPKLVEIPEFIHQISNLTLISIDSISLEKCHPALFTLPSLRTLIIRHPQKLTLPKKVSNISPLEEIRITHANITLIPKWFDKLKATLRVLDLSNNRIQSIGPIFSRFYELKEIDLSHNQIDNEDAIDILSESLAAERGVLKKIRLLPNPVREDSLKKYWVGDLW